MVLSNRLSRLTVPLLPEPRLLQLNVKLTAYQGGGALQGFQRHVAFRLQDPVKLGTAGVHTGGKIGLADALPFHFLRELPRHDPHNSGCFGGLVNAFLLEKVV